MYMGSCRRVQRRIDTGPSTTAEVVSGQSGAEGAQSVIRYRSFSARERPWNCDYAPDFPSAST